jgi:AraC-like DNA-binding protein
VTALELTLRAIGVAQLAILGWVMFRARRRDDVGRIGAALCLSVAAFLVTSAHGVASALGILVYPLSAICSTHPVWFWLFCASLFGDARRLSTAHAISVGAMAAAGLLYWLMSPDVPWFMHPFGIGLGLASFTFICLGPLSVARGRAADLDERRRRIRNGFLPVVSVYLAAVVAAQIIVLLVGRPTPRALVLLNLAVIDSLAALALLTFMRVRVLNWLDLTDPAPATQALSRVERSVLERLNRRLLPERLYAREGLTIAGLAELLDTREHILRRVINRGLGFRNFNDFLHAHRLREAGRRLRDPAERRVPVLTIALEVGYGSIGPFNRAFKERFGVTPTAFRRGQDPETGSPIPKSA